VGHLRGVAGGDAAVGLEYRAQFAQDLRRGAGARAFVVFDDAAVFTHAAVGEVGMAVIQFERGDFILEQAGLLCGQGAAVAFGGEGVLGFAADLPLFGDVFGGDAHAVGDADVFVGEDGRVHLHLVAHHRHHAHGFGTTGQHQVGFTEADAI